MTCVDADFIITLSAGQTEKQHTFVPAPLIVYMRNTFDLGISIPLEKASDRRRCGVTAVVLCELIRKGVRVPLGFCLSADAYRSHLWASGARETAACCEDPTHREVVRNALVSAEIPSDVLNALEDIYESIGGRAVVMPSPCAQNLDCAKPPNSFEVGTFDELIACVKNTWASLWNEESAVTTNGLGKEPAMAVVVQALVDEEASGNAITANPLNGDPNEIEIRADNAGGVWTLGVHPFRVIHESVSKEGQALSEKILLDIARSALVAEEVIGKTAEIRWSVKDGEVFLLSAGCAKGVRQFFPYDADSLGEGAFWRLVSVEPVSMLARSLIASSDRLASSILPFRGYAAVKVIGGRVYRLAVSPAESNRRRVRVLFGDAIKSRLAAGGWRKAKSRITKRSRQILRSDPTSETDERLWTVFADAFNCACESLAWFEVIPKAAYESARILRELVASLGRDTVLINRLLRSVGVNGYGRDIEFQRLAAYVWQAEQIGDSKGLAGQVQDTTLEFGYAFRRSLDARDPACWVSWIEEPKIVLKIARAVARGPVSDRISAAKDAIHDRQECERLLCSGLNLFRRRSLKRALARARFWVEAAWERSEVHALAMTALRIAAIALGARFVERGLLENRDDIFLLRFEEIRSIMSGSSADFIAGRKWDLMRERRLFAPKWIPRAPSYEAAPFSGRYEGIVGTPGSSGIVEGKARVAANLDEVAAIKPGEILVCEDVCPAWTPLLTLASGLLMAKGDMISPGTMAARDLGIPCIYQATGVHSISNGVYLRMNGDTGTVEIIGRRKPRVHE